MAALRTMFAIPFIVVYTAFIALTALTVGLLFPSTNDAICLLWSRGIVFAAGARVSIAGAERLDPGTRYVFVANHQSLFDIPALWVSIPNPFRFVAKQELARIPLFGAAMRAVGTVVVDRANPAAAAKSLEAAQSGIARVCSLCFFAEGTRSPDGKLRPFKKGGVVTALAMGAPLVPVAIAGTRDIVKKGGFVIRSGPVRVTVGEPIPVIQGETSHEVRSQLLGRLEREVAGMLGADRHP